MHLHNQLTVICSETAVIAHHFTSCHSLSSRSCMVWKGGSWSRVSSRTLCSHGNPASRTSFIAIPNIVFFPNPGSLCPNFCESRFPGSGQIPCPINVANPALYFGRVRIPFNVSRIPYSILVKSLIPFNVSRIPHCILVKSRIPFNVSRIPHCILVKSRIPFNVSRIPHCILLQSWIPGRPFQTPVNTTFN